MFGVALVINDRFGEILDHFMTGLVLRMEVCNVISTVRYLWDVSPVRVHPVGMTYDGVSLYV